VQITKLKMFLLLNGSIAAGLLLYFLLWICSPTITGDLVTPYEPTMITVRYQVKGKTYKETFMRNGIDYQNRRVSLRYLALDPEVSRVNSFMGSFAEPLAWWLVFFIASSMLLLTNNTVFSKGTIFRLQKKFPWISMEEYFPASWYEEAPHEDVPMYRKKKVMKQIGRKD
jgi:hypothetical protein